jgi:malonyl-CoA O-methyltransferase
MHAVIDKRLLRERFGRSLKSYAGHAAVQNSMAVRLSEMVCREGHGCQFDRVMEVGSGTGVLTAELLKRRGVNVYYANDIVDESRIFLQKVFERYPVGEFIFLAGDIEAQAVIPSCLDLVVSNATLQWLGDLDTFFRKISMHLDHGGMLAFSSFGPMNMHEIAAIEQIGLDYQSLAEIERIAGRYFLIEECLEEEVTLEFDSPEAVLHHIRVTGVNAVARRSWTKSRYQRFLETYRQRFSSRNGVILTYHPLFCRLKKRNS